MSDGLAVLDQRPPPGTPREYHFPPFARDRLSNGLTVIHAHLAGRPLLAAQLLLLDGAASEPAEQGGVTALAARAISEGTKRRDATEFIEASERLGAELHADAGWESFTASVEVPRSRFGPALALLAEMLLEPAFPEHEVDRLREERINDLLQARAEPRRRVERAFLETIYAPGSPFARPLAGGEETVPRLDREQVADRHRAILDPASATLIVAGDLVGVPLLELAEEHLGGWERADRATATMAADGATPEGAAQMPHGPDAPHPAGRRVVVVDRPGSPQTEVRVGHVGLRRRIPDFHAVVVMSAILGGLFNSRLQRLLREERGYTYGIAAGFEMRRSAGPFSVRTAVQTEVTAPAVQDIVSELRRMREAPIEPAELTEARDYLVGVFPLRFESPAQVVGAISGLVTNELPDDELDRYRPAIAAVSAEDAAAAAQRIRPDDASIALVGDAARIEGALRDAGLGPVEVVRDPLLSALASDAAEERPATVEAAADGDGPDREEGG